MIYQLFASPKKKIQNPQDQAIENRKTEQIKKISQDLQKAGGIGKQDSQSQLTRKGAINHHRQIIQERKKKLNSKQIQPEVSNKEKKNYLPSAKKGQLFFDPFAKGATKSKYNISQYEKQKIEANNKSDSSKVQNKQSQALAKANEKAIISSPVDQKEIKKSQVQTLYSRNKQNMNASNVKTQQTKEQFNANLKTPSKSIKDLKIEDKIVESEKIDQSAKFKRTHQAKTINQKPKVQNATDKNEKFIKAPNNVKPEQIIQINQIQDSKKVQSPKYSEVVKKKEQQMIKYQQSKNQVKKQLEFHKLQNNNKVNYKRDGKNISSLNERKQDQQIQLFFDPFRKKQAKGPILNAQSSKNQIIQKPKSNKKDQKLNKSCDKQQKRQSEAEALKIQNQLKRKKQQTLKDQQAKRKAAQIAAENEKKKQEAAQLAKNIQKKNQKSLETKNKLVASIAIAEEKNIQVKNLQNIYNKNKSSSALKQESKINQIKNEKTYQESVIINQSPNKLVEKNNQKNIASNSPNKNIYQSKDALKKQQEQKKVQIKQPLISHATPVVKKRHKHQYQHSQRSLKKSVNKSPQSISPIKQIINKQKLVLIKHSQNQSITKQEYQELINQISHLEEYIESNEQHLTEAHNDIARKKQMLEDARQQIIDKNRLIMELKFEDYPKSVIMPQRFHYWSLQQNIFYKSRDPVGQIVQQRRKAARESRIINHQILSHSHIHMKHQSRVSLKEETNINNMLRNAKSQGIFKLNLSHGHQKQNQEMQKIDDSRVIIQKYQDDSSENSQFYIGLLERLKSRVTILKRQNQTLQRGLIIR